MKENIEVLRPGSLVEIKDSNNVSGIICQVVLKPGLAAEYQVEWWAGSIRYEAWFPGCRLVQKGYAVTRIGYM